jgi:hypothetical protein
MNYRIPLCRGRRLSSLETAGDLNSPAARLSSNCKTLAKSSALVNLIAIILLPKSG